MDWHARDMEMRDMFCEIQERKNMDELFYVVTNFPHDVKWKGEVVLNLIELRCDRMHSYDDKLPARQFDICVAQKLPGHAQILVGSIS